MHSRKQNSIAEQQVLLAPGHQTPSLSVMYAEFCRVCGAHSQRRPALALRCCGAPREREHQCALCRDCAARTPWCQGKKMGKKIDGQPPGPRRLQNLPTNTNLTERMLRQVPTVPGARALLSGASGA